ncbi:MAG: hypothetical protein AAB411_01715 [Patescibacteria group bacterium]
METIFFVFKIIVAVFLATLAIVLAIIFKRAVFFRPKLKISKGLKAYEAAKSSKNQ